MKRLLSICLGILFVLPTLWHPDDPLAQVKRSDYLIHSSTGHALDMDRPMELVPVLRVSAAIDTMWIYEYTFDTPRWLRDDQGWVGLDRTVQVDAFFHVAGPSELDGGSFGRLVPLEGIQSLWCGVSGSGAGCGYATSPGYGNRWTQFFVSRFFDGASIQLTYKIQWDTEPGYDFVYTQYETGDGNWVDIPVNGGVGYYDGYGTAAMHSYHITPPDSARFRFQFTSDVGWSDEDGKWDTDGAVLLDSITVEDQQGLHFEDFEDESPGARHTQDWDADFLEGYGDFAGLYPGFSVLQVMCDRNMNHLWAFFNGSTYNYNCGGHPEQLAVPYENTRGQYLANDVCSPVIPWVGPGGSLVVQFDVYRDLPLDNLVFYVWRVRSIVAGCAGPWLSSGIYYYGGYKDWRTETFEAGTLIDPEAEGIQVAIGAEDMCRVWCGVYGTGTCHSHAPLIDNVRIARIEKTGPQWTVRDVDLFQDTFPPDGTVTGTAPADAAYDTNPQSNPVIAPRDEVIVTCASHWYIPLAPDPLSGFGPAAYCYVSVLPPGQPGKIGPAIVDDSFRWPFVGQFTQDGTLWYQVRMDTVFDDPDARLGIVDDQYCVDLNDNLFTPGDTILFVFGAEDEIGGVTYWSQFTGTKEDFAEVATLPMEFQVFPGGGWLRGGEILYVDDFSGRGAQPYFDTVFDKMGIRDQIDRYDVRAPTSMVGNGLGGRVMNADLQLAACYNVIIWNSGNLTSGTIGDGTGSSGLPGPEKGDDFYILYWFLDQHPGDAGLYISGDNVAEEWVSLFGINAISLRASYMSFNLTDGDHHNDGFYISPLVIGEPMSMFDDIMGPDTLVAFGGCPGIKNFDVLEPTTPATSEATYQGTGVATKSAVISQVTANNGGGTARVVLSGFSYHYIRDDRPVYPCDRSDHLYDILTGLNQIVPPPVTPDPGEQHVNRLLQNRRNPFNPSTTIEYSIGERARVTLRIYNVSGQLVRTLVDEVQPPLGLRAVVWDGRNNQGQPVASGVYLYKLDTKYFSQTKKMVLLK